MNRKKLLSLSVLTFGLCLIASAAAAQTKTTRLRGFDKEVSQGPNWQTPDFRQFGEDVNNQKNSLSAKEQNELASMVKEVAENLSPEEAKELESLYGRLIKGGGQSLTEQDLARIEDLNQKAMKVILDAKQQQGAGSLFDFSE